MKTKLIILTTILLFGLSNIKATTKEDYQATISKNKTNGYTEKQIGSINIAKEYYIITAIYNKNKIVSYRLKHDCYITDGTNSTSEYLCIPIGKTTNEIRNLCHTNIENAKRCYDEKAVTDDLSAILSFIF